MDVPSQGDLDSSASAFPEEFLGLDDDGDMIITGGTFVADPDGGVFQGDVIHLRNLNQFSRFNLFADPPSLAILAGVLV